MDSWDYKCTATLNIDLTNRTALQCHQEQICRRSDGQPLTLLDVLTVEIKDTSGGADCPAPDTAHLFSVLPFPPLPIL
jgi:hypothetical protein